MNYEEINRVLCYRIGGNSEEDTCKLNKKPAMWKLHFQQYKKALIHWWHQ